MSSSENRVEKIIGDRTINQGTPQVGEFICLLDTTGEVRAANSLALEILHGKQGEKIFSCFSPPDAELIDLAVRRVAERQSAMEMVQAEVQGDQGRLRFCFTFYPLIEDAAVAGMVMIGQPTGIVRWTDMLGKVVHQEPSDRTQLELEIEKLSSQIETLSESAMDISSTMVPYEIMNQMIGKVVEALSLDVAAVRMLDGQHHPHWFCSGMSLSNAKSLFDQEVGGMAMHEWVEGRHSYITVDKDQDVLFCEVPELPRSFILCSIGFNGSEFGCAMFGVSRPEPDMRHKALVLQIFLSQVAMMERNERTRSEIITRNRELQTMYDISKVLSATLDRKSVVDLILHKAMGLVSAENCFIFEADKKDQKLRCIASQSASYVDVLGIELQYGEGISGLVAKSGEGMLIERADEDPRSILVNGTDDDPSSIISVPLRIGNEVIGVMTLEKRPGVPFNQSEYRLVEMFSVQAAVALKNAETVKTLRRHISDQRMYNTLLTHDVANYNVPIHGFLEMLIKDPKLDDRQRRYVRSALVQSENITNLVSDVRKLWWLRTRDEDLPLKSVDIVPLIREVVDSMRNNSLFLNVDIDFRCETAQACIWGDNFSKDIFYNLLSNACKYGDMKPISIVLYRVQEAGNPYWRLDVMDRGKGIPDERKEALFKRFDQLDSMSAAEGHGLGLSVVKAFCERYGGKVWVQNRVPGDHTQGSVFSLLLPLAVEKCS